MLLAPSQGVGGVIDAFADLDGERFGIVLSVVVGAHWFVPCPVAAPAIYCRRRCRS
jgi:hypothetical protein